MSDDDFDPTEYADYYDEDSEYAGYYGNEGGES